MVTSIFLMLTLNLWMVSFILARMLNQLTQVYIYFGQVLLITRIKWAYFIAYCFARIGFFLTRCYSIMRLLG